MLFRILILVIQLKKLTTTQKLKFLKRKLLIMIYIISTPKLNKLTIINFAERLQQTKSKLANKDDIVDFIKKTNFDKKLKQNNNKVTSNKTRHVEVKKYQMII